MQTAPAPPHRRPWYSPTSIGRSLLIRPRVFVGVAIAALALGVLPATLAPPIRGAVAWDAGGIAYLGLAFASMRRCHADVIRARAARQDDSGLVILALILLAIAASFTAIAGLIGVAKAAPADARLWYLALAATTIVVSWLVTQVVFTLHYAHEHYAPDTRDAIVGGLTFPGDEHPDYWDFFYFATSIGASSQTSDTAIRSKALRRLVTLHAIVSFFFNTMVLALTINLAASLV